ncbi:MAG: TRAP transporter small permease [Paracoccus sp. (in: a-proteobacteria)]|nr:TRAP transporter small permease [Paracoccus sp. (in: a-proteobacteria)]
MKDAANRLARGVDIAARSLGGAGVAVLSGLIAWVVFSRYALGTTPRWSEELPRLILVWVTWLGVASAFIRGSHFEAGILPLILRDGPARRAAGWLARIATFCFLVVLVVTGWKITLFTWSHAMTALTLPKGLFYLALPVGAGASLIGMIAARLAR